MTSDREWFRDHDLMLQRLKESQQCTRAAEPAPERPAPKVIGRYRIKRVIASGGMGTVYEAAQDHPKRSVAVKVMRHGMTSRSAMRRFEHESQVLARLRHPGIAQVYETGTFDDGTGAVPFFAMEYIPEARSLTEYARDEALSTRRRLELFAQVCDAVHHGHQKGVIHRDLKPGNILIDAEGHPKIIDFGVARGTDADIALTTLQTSFGQLIGTLQYMSPEQCAADPHDLDLRSDVYALGVLLYELLTDRLPYDVSDTPVLESTRMICQQPPTRLSAVNAALKGDVETIVLKALEKDRDHRYQSAAELGQDARRFLAGEAIIARPPSFVYQLRVFTRRNKAAVAAVAVVFLVLVAASVVSTSMYFRADIARADAEAARDAEQEQRTLAEAREAEAVAAREAEAAQREAAEASAARATQVATLLKEILSGAGPSSAQGRDTTLLRDILDETVERIEVELADQPDVLAEMRKTIADTYVDLGYFVRAVPLCKEVVAYYRAVGDDDSPEFANALFGLADLGGVDESFDQESLFREALAIYRNVYGNEHRNVAMCLTILGEQLWRENRLDEAEEAIREAITIEEELADTEDEVFFENYQMLANIMQARGDDAEAERLYRKALAGARQHISPQDPMLTWAIEPLADYLRDKGDVAEAADLYREIYTLHRNVYDPDFPNTGARAAKLINALRALGDDEGAEAVLAEHLEYARSDLGECHPIDAAVRNNLAAFYVQLKRFGEAEGIWIRLLQRCRADMGDIHPVVRATVEGLTALYQQTKRNELALALWQEHLPACRAELGEGHGSTIEAVGALAAQHLQTGDFDGAEAIWQEHLALCREGLGDDDSVTVKATRELGNFYFTASRFDLAEPLLRLDHEQRVRELGELHPVTLDTHERLQYALAAQGKTTEARRVGSELLALRQRRVESPDATVRDRDNYAWLLLVIEPDDLRDPEMALAAARRAVEVSARKDGSSLDTLAVAHEMTGDLDAAIAAEHEALALLPPARSGSGAGWRQALVRFFEKKGRMDAAAQVCRDGVELCREHAPSDRERLAIALILLGRTLVDHGKYAEAEPVLRECLEIRREVLVAGHWLIGNAMSNLGEALAGQGKYEEVEPLLVDGFEQIRAREWSINYLYRDARLREALHRLIDFYDAWGKRRLNRVRCPSRSPSQQIRQVLGRALGVRAYVLMERPGSAEARFAGRRECRSDPPSQRRLSDGPQTIHESGCHGPGRCRGGFGGSGRPRRLHRLVGVRGRCG
ncbi:MAG: protein kinase domain-containing protein [Planctomycetota bacterium]|jgi:non-specific serine/threonine protein kinase/serine/threonine-protein kinase